jgi:hypothetical protein
LASRFDADALPNSNPQAMNFFLTGPFIIMLADTENAATKHSDAQTDIFLCIFIYLFSVGLPY